MTERHDRSPAVMKVLRGVNERRAAREKARQKGEHILDESLGCWCNPMTIHVDGKRPDEGGAS